MRNKTGIGPQLKDEESLKKLKKENAELKSKIEQQKEEIESIIEQRTKELIDLIETKDKFLKLISHELRNPFNSILGYVSLLKENYREYDYNKVDQFLTIIYRSTSITFDLLTNLLEWLNARDKRIIFSPDNYNISELLSEEIVNTSIIGEQKQVIIKNIIPINLCAYFDSNMLKTVFRNLIINAIKFSNKGSEVIISALEHVLILNYYYSIYSI